MKSVIVGTAGHIDHGKTALVKALTGIDADRLEEEKRRGITIDLGFAHLDLPVPGGQTLRLGFVDVPGHERFVRNMLAGVGGIDLVLLVIAADEGIKPQTCEHFDICRLLSVQRGITVLTKSDLVDPETLGVVKMEIGDFLRGSFLDPSRSPIVAVSSLTGAGHSQLLEELAKAAAEVPARDSGALPRLPIDRVFTMKGFGTVVTGTLISGSIRKDDELELFPGNRRVRVRGIQVHGQSTDKAVAGERTALNLGSISTGDLSRGMVLAPPAIFHATSIVDVQVSLLSASKPLKDRARIHFHAYTSEAIATVKLFDKKQISPGETTFARLHLSEPVLIFPCDRFIVRQFSPVITIGGGIVVENTPPKKVREKAVYADLLEILASESDEGRLRARLTASGTRGLSIAELIARSSWTAAQVHALASNIPDAIRIQDHFISKLALDMVRKGVVSVLDAFHKGNPLDAGISREELRGHFPEVAPEIFGRVLQDALQAKTIELSGEFVRLPGRGVVMKDDEAEAKQLIESAFASAGLAVPALQDVLASLKLDKARAQKIVTLLLRNRILVKVSDDLVFHRDALLKLRAMMAAEKTKSPKIDVARFKDLTGVSRKYAIPLLEYLDRERVTRRVGNERVIL